MFLFCKLYDYNNLVGPNAVISQLCTSKTDATLFSQTNLKLVIKRVKTKNFSNIATALSIFFLLHGIYPFGRLNIKKDTADWNVLQCFRAGDIILFLLRYRLKKTKENLNFFNSIHTFSLTFDDLACIYNLYHIDYLLGGCVNIKITFTLMNTFRAKKHFNLLRTHFSL